MSSNKYIRSLERGLEVLLALQEFRHASLHELAKATALPKSTVKRILLTLENAGFVHRSIGDHRYRISVKVQRIARHLDERDSLMETAKPVLETLCRKLVWPSDLLVRHDEVLIVSESSRAISPFNINQDNIGFRVNFLMSASGRAYLAYCPFDEKEEIVDKLRHSSDPSYQLAHKREKLDAILREVKEQRFALRDPTYGGGYGLRRPTNQDGMMAIAVPILSETGVEGVVSMVWFPTAVAIDKIIGEFLDELWIAADEIASNLPALVK